MDWVGLLLLGIGILVGIPALAIGAMVIATGLRHRVARLEMEVEAARAALSQLSARLDATSGPASAHAAMQAEAGSETVTAPPMERASPAETGHPPSPPPSRTVSGTPPAAPPQSPPAAGPIVPPPPPSVPAYQPPVRSFEESLGTRWTVWVGGLALAFGGIFLVKYSIEQGYFGPAARVVFGLMFAVALIGLGEFLRRRDGAPGAERAAVHIPAILTAAGTVAAFASVYSAQALYHLIDVTTAFVALGAVAVGTMLAALLHGPWIAVLGVLGAYLTPLLIHSATPNLPGLTGYLLTVTASAFGVARLRLWPQVAMAALVPALGWGLVEADLAAAQPLGTMALAIYIAGLAGLVAAILVVSIDDAPDPLIDRPLNPFGLIALGGVLLLGLVYLPVDGFGLQSLFVSALLVVGGLGLSVRYPAVVPTSALSGMFALLALLAWTVDLPATLDTGVLVQSVDGIISIRPRQIVEFGWIAGLTAALFFVAGGYGALKATPGADRTSGWLAASATLVPAALAVIAWIRIAGWVPHPLFAGLALGAAALNGGLTQRLVLRERTDAPAASVAMAAVGTISAMTAAMTIAFEHGALTIALALMAPALAWVYRHRPIAILKPIAALVSLVVLARIIWEPNIAGDLTGTWPIINWLLYGYGIPALGFAYAAWIFRRSAGEAGKSDPAIGLLEALAIVFAGLLVVFQIRHLLHGGDILLVDTNLVELGLLTTSGLIGSVALSRIAGRLGSEVYDKGSLVVSGLALMIAAAGLLLGVNPGLTGDSIGAGLLINDLLPGYLVPAAAAALAAHLVRHTRPLPYAMSLSSAALILAFVWVTLITRHLFQGPNVGMIGPYLRLLPHTSDEEFWAYSLVWLAFGVAALFAGVLFKSQAARGASALILILTVSKVFLLDMSALTGILRALSFIGLGAVLIGIGWLYQKLLFSSKSINQG